MDDAAIAAAFIARYLEDRRSGRPRPVREYQDLFAGHDDLIAREYADLEGRGASAVLAHGALSAAGTKADERSTGALRVAHYEIVRELGRGGQGVVYLARDLRLGRSVALKVLTAWAGGSSEMLQRFRREAEIASRLDHPGICGVHDAGIDGGVPYIAMRYVEGESLSRRISRTKPQAPLDSVSILDLESDTATAGEPGSADNPSTPAPATRIEIFDLLEIVRKAALALHAAHEAGVIHRDIKPGNILVTPDDEPVILDFGLARATDDESPALTRTGDVFGTPAYMSPEQLRGDVRAIDRRTDVWSLGVVLYEALSGRRPFTAATRHRLADAILRQEPDEPRRLNRVVPRDLAVVLLTALEKDPARRYQTARDFADELRRVRTFEPVQARPAGAILKLRRWSQRNPALATTLFVSCAIVGLALGFAIAQMIEVKRALVDVSAESAAKDEALRRAEAHRLAALSTARAAVNPGQSLLLALEGARVLDSPVTRQALWGAIGGIRERRTFIGHTQGVNCVALSPDGRYALTGSTDMTARLWEANSGREILRLPQERIPYRVGFHPRGDRFFVVRSDGTYDARTGLRTGDQEHSTDLAVHSVPDGRLLWSPPPGSWRSVITEDLRRFLLLDDERGVAELWDWPPESELPGPARSMEALARTWGVLSPDGGLYAYRTQPSGFVSDRREGPTRILDLDTGESKLELKSPVVAINRTAGLIACVEKSSPILDAQVVRSLEDGGKLWKADRSRRKEGSPVDWDFFSSDGGTALVNDDGNVSVCDARKGDRLHFLGRAEKLSQRLSTRAAFTSDAKEVIVASLDGAVTLWGARSGSPEGEFQGHDGVVDAIAVATDGRSLLTGSKDGTARLWDRRSGLDRLVTPAGMGIAMRTVAVTANHRWIVGTLQATSQVPVWDVESLERRKHQFGIAGFFGNPSTVLSADGRHVAITEHSSVVIVGDLESGKAEVRLSTPGEVTVFSRFSPDGELLVTSHHRRPPASGAGRMMQPNVRIWRWRTSEEIARIDSHVDLVGGAAFDPEGRRLLLASCDGAVSCWDTRTWSRTLDIGPESISGPAGKPADHQRRSLLVHVHFVGDRDHLVHSFDNKIRVCDLRSGARVMSLEVPEADPALGLCPLAVDPRGRFVAAVACSQGLLIVWDLETGKRVHWRTVLAGVSEDSDVVGVEPAGAIVDWSADGRFLLTSLPGGRVEVVSIRSFGEPWLTVGGSEYFVTAAAFTPDGKSLVCGMGNGQVLKVPLDLAPLARSLAPRELTPDERDRFEVGTTEDRARFREAWNTRPAPPGNR